MASSPIIVLLIMLFLLATPVALGIVLILTSRIRSLGYPACGACHYNLSASIGSVERCPECGALFKAVGILPPVGARQKLKLWVGIALVALPLLCVGGFMGSAMIAVRTRQAMPAPVIAPAPGPAASPTPGDPADAAESRDSAESGGTIASSESE